MDLLVEEGIRNTDVFIATHKQLPRQNILSCYLAQTYWLKRTIQKLKNVDYLGLLLTWVLTL
jgi:hypothetical protein